MFVTLKLDMVESNSWSSASTYCKKMCSFSSIDACLNLFRSSVMKDCLSS